jgi:hypothetical protein
MNRKGGFSVIAAVNSEPGGSRPMGTTHGHGDDWYVPLKLNTPGGPSYGLGAILAGMNEWNILIKYRQTGKCG